MTIWIQRSQISLQNNENLNVKILKLQTRNNTQILKEVSILQCMYWSHGCLHRADLSLFCLTASESIWKLAFLGGVKIFCTLYYFLLIGQTKIYLDAFDQCRLMMPLAEDSNMLVPIMEVCNLLERLSHVYLCCDGMLVPFISVHSILMAYASLNM